LGGKVSNRSNRSNRFFYIYIEKIDLMIITEYNCILHTFVFTIYKKKLHIEILKKG